VACRVVLYRLAQGKVVGVGGTHDYSGSESLPGACRKCIGGGYAIAPI
jgi:hypothetical protein